MSDSGSHAAENSSLVIVTIDSEDGANDIVAGILAVLFEAIMRKRGTVSDDGNDHGSRKRGIDFIVLRLILSHLRGDDCYASSRVSLNIEGDLFVADGMRWDRWVEGSLRGRGNMCVFSLSSLG